MTPEDKELLLKDLCGRSPYNVVINCTEEDDERTNFDCFFTAEMVKDIQNEIAMWNIKPYLRPMSSMTEEEKQECCSIFNGSMYQFEVNEYGDVESTKPTVEREHIYYDCELMAKWLDWLNAHNFDYRGLIEKRLALEAPKNMYNLNNK